MIYTHTYKPVLQLTVGLGFLQINFVLCSFAILFTGETWGLVRRVSPVIYTHESPVRAPGP